MLRHGSLRKQFDMLGDELLPHMRPNALLPGQFFQPGVHLPRICSLEKEEGNNVQRGASAPLFIISTEDIFLSRNVTSELKFLFLLDVLYSSHPRIGDNALYDLKIPNTPRVSVP